MQYFIKTYNYLVNHFLLGATLLAAGFLLAGFLVTVFFVAGFLATFFVAALVGLDFVIFFVFLAGDLVGEAAGAGVAVVVGAVTTGTFFGVVTFFVTLVAVFFVTLMRVLVID
jgi:hypothetical protein